MQNPLQLINRFSGCFSLTEGMPVATNRSIFCIAHAEKILMDKTGQAGMLPVEVSSHCEGMEKPGAGMRVKGHKEVRDNSAAHQSFADERITSSTEVIPCMSLLMPLRRRVSIPIRMDSFFISAADAPMRTSSRICSCIGMTS